MSKRNKLAKFAQINEYTNVYENFSVLDPRLMANADEEADLKGRWANQHFGNNNPITLEIGCGRGEYSLGLARLFPSRNFIGIDVKGARIWKGASIALEEGLDNVAFLRTRVECIEEFFAQNEIADIWITFPDPFPREGQVNRRLTAANFREKFIRMLQPGGNIHLKTDNTGLFMFTLEDLIGDPHFKIEEIYDNIDAGQSSTPELSLMTYYERVHREKGAKIKYTRMVYQ